LLLGGCTTTKEAVLPQDGKPMKQIYEEHFEQIGEQSAEHARAQLGRGPGAGDEDLRGYVRNAQTEIHATFARLPNPTTLINSGTTTKRRNPGPVMSRNPRSKKPAPAVNPANTSAPGAQPNL